MSSTHHPTNPVTQLESNQPVREDAMMQFREIAPDRKREHESNLGLPTPLAPSQPNVKRTKTEQACSNCRALRRKCNGGSPCKTCQENSLPCHYGGDVRAPEKLTLAKAMKRIAQLEDRLRIYEGYTAGQSQNEAGLSPPRHSDQVYATATEASRSEDDMAQLLRGVNYLTISRNPEFYGGSSSNAIISAVEATEELGDQSSTSRMEWPLNRASLWLENAANLRFAKVAGSSLPPRPVADDYVNRYFQTAHRLYPILNRISFMERYRNFWEGLPTEGKGYELWAAVLYMVLAHGHQCSTVDPDDRVRNDALASQHGETCFNLAKSTFVDVPFSGGDMSAVNSMFLAFVWLFNQQRLHEAYAMLGTSARIGYAIGLHRELKSVDAHVLDTNGWCATWWCLFIYETELATLSGRPCGIQPREVDVRPFPLDTSPIDLQYLERMRQFSYLAWDAYEQVYSLAFKHSGVSERAAALRAADGAICAWYDGWYHDSTWSKEPHGLVIRLRYLNLRILLYRAFLNLVVQKREKQMEVKEESVVAAARCIEMAMSLIHVTTTSINVGSSGTLQAALFHTMGYLWNATLALLLYVRSESTHDLLAATIPDRGKIIDTIESAAVFFTRHQEALPFARVASEKIRRLLKKVATGYVSSDTPSTSTDIHAGFAVPNLESPDRILNFVPGFDVPAFDIPRFNFETAFPGSSPPVELPGLEGREDNRANPHWIPEGEGFYFYGSPDAG
ncbi:uncharacterized protein PV07_11019 [Cladophialophora immunda]|uniref:Zn(2)-C6 fungal-type domain-containing protein n=1 Tax=Cladophialophora immunda TaxID=569365 RepID=A0A0D2BUK7_9EURO|nr:uncharacterized protein PV07_11019 [Cladophialophora immunda]KIW22753.1 hypothetical protein PV07_11019 [Cladophialophora immunda]OQU94029.1 Fungal Zn2-Cys6 binuclear cluster domain-containing protein [Cladophialophora immunda]